MEAVELLDQVLAQPQWMQASANQQLVEKWSVDHQAATIKLSEESNVNGNESELSLIQIDPLIIYSLKIFTCQYLSL